jgi:hypothetical protein
MILVLATPGKEIWPMTGTGWEGEDASASARTVSRRSLLRALGAGGVAVVGGVSLPAAGVSARRFGARPAVYPSHDTWTASPRTEISFRGVTEADLGTVVVTGSGSGGKSGLLKPHADGNGVSYVPDSDFNPGEVVTVRADVRLAPTRDGSLTFGIAHPAELVHTATDRVTNAPEVPTHHFRSRPDLQPPRIDITEHEDGTSEGHIFLGVRVEGGQRGALVVDNAGEPVWFSPAANELDDHTDVRVQEYFGEPVITFIEGNGPRGYNRGHFVMCDGGCERIAEFGIGNGYAGGGDLHELTLTSRSTALVGAYHAVTWDLSPVGGSKYGTVLDCIVQELEIETGRVLFEWHSLDHVEIDETHLSAPTNPGEPFDYFHLNSIGVTPDGNLIVNARHTFACYKVDGMSGDVIWRLNGKRSDFAMGEGTTFAWQHDALLHPGGVLTVFDNASADQEDDATVDSRGLVLALDEEAMTATLVRAYIHPTGILSTTQANVQVLPNGNVFIGWGSAPVFSEFSHDGALIFNGRLPVGSSSYRAYRFSWVGEPAEPPAVAAQRGAGGSVTVYASWNGATEVATWRVLAGRSAENLAEVGSAPRAGFETAIDVTTGASWLAVEALGAGGAILGASDAIQV